MFISILITHTNTGLDKVADKTYYLLQKYTEQLLPIGESLMVYSMAN